jgi:capsular exopolysaccharide synthesis family protein
MSLEPQDGQGGEPEALPPALSISSRSPALTVPRTLATTPIEATAADPRERAMSASLLHIWNIVVKWRWPIAAMASLGLAAGVIVTMLTTPIYRATTTIQIDSEPAKVEAVANPSSFNWNDPEKYYLTQYELLRSRALAERVAQSENLGDDDALMHPRQRQSILSRLMGRKPKPPSPAGHAARTASAASMVASGLNVDPVRASRLVKISFENPDPAVAARIANSVAANFISWNLERRYDASAAARKFLEDRLAQTRQALEDSQRRGNAFAQQNRLITVPSAPAAAAPGAPTPTASGSQTGESIDAADLAALDQSLSLATAARIQAQQHLSQAQSTPDAQLPEVIADPSYQALRAQRDAANAEYQQNLRLYRPNFPTMVDAKAKIDALNQQIAAVASSIRGGLKAQFETAAKNEGQLRGEVEARKGRLLASQGKRVEEGFINTDISTSQSLYDSMLASYKQIGVSGAIEENNISFVDRAQPPHYPIKPQPLNNLFTFGAVGLVLGIGLAFLLEQFDLSLKVPEDVERELGIPVLATIPVLGSNTSAVKALENPKSQLSEGYYSARAALELSTEDGVPRNLLVTSSMKGEGKSTSALALAAGFGRLGMRVLLIDADMRNPSQHRMLARDNSVGLSNLLAGGSDVSPAFQPTGYANLTFLAAGRPPPNPSELLAGGKMLQLLTAAREHFDLVVIDAPPVMGLADAPQLANITAGVLMVVEANSTKRDIAKGAVRRLHATHAHLLGALFTKFDIKKAGYAYGYAYSYGYGRGYGFDYGATPQPVGRLAGLLRLAQSVGDRRKD